jgi:hypothetical protein
MQEACVRAHLIAAVTLDAADAVGVDDSKAGAQQRAIEASLIVQCLPVLQGARAACEQTLVLVVVALTPCTSAAHAGRAHHPHPTRVLKPKVTVEVV